MTIFVGQKEVAMRLPLEIPELDKDQVKAARAMARGDRLLFSDPGAGKTLTALEAWREVGFDFCLVVCPVIAVRNWAIWADAYARRCNRPITVQIMRGNKDLIRDDVDMVIVTYGTLRQKGSAVLQELKDFIFGVIILDESDNLNTDGAQGTTAIYGEADGLAMYANKVWPMTGTPIPRYQDGLYPVLRCLFPERLEEFKVLSKEKFLDTFTHRKLVKYGHMRFPVKKVMGSRNEALMKELLYGGDDPIAIRNKLIIRSVVKHRFVTLDFNPSKELLALQKEVLEKDGAFVPVDDFGNPISEVNPKLNQALHLLSLIHI